MNLNQRKHSMKPAEAAPTKVRERKRPTRTTAAAGDQAMGRAPADAATASGDGSAAFSPAERTEMIAIAAYHRAERRGFSGGSPEQDWLEAEAEIDRALDRQRP